jgi:hypothetical protein
MVSTRKATASCDKEEETKENEKKELTCKKKADVKPSVFVPNDLAHI